MIDYETDDLNFVPDYKKFEYVVRVSSSNKPSTCWGRYYDIAVMKVIKGTFPKMISRRARGVVDIYQYWRMCNVGNTDKCCYMRTIKEANEICEKLNNKLKEG